VVTDAELIAASLRDPERFAGVFDRHFAAIAAFLRRRLERSLADELAAETFLRAFDCRGGYDVARADARPWLFGIAARLLSHHRRSEERRLRAFARVGRMAGEERGFDEVDARLDAMAASSLLAAALRSLSAADREVLLLYAWAELTYEEIAVALEIPVGTVRSRLHRAREGVRRGLGGAAVTTSIAAAGNGEGGL
jgi:RNA polymerase sigma-70 factor (ECF subfamily)